MQPFFSVGNIQEKFVSLRMTLAIRLKDKREAAGLSQKELADLVGLTQQSIASIEDGTTQHPRKIKKIATVLATTPEELLYGVTPADAFMGLDSDTFALFVSAAAKLASPALDRDARNTVIGALRMVAKQEVPIYRSDPAQAGVANGSIKKSKTA